MNNKMKINSDFRFVLIALLAWLGLAYADESRFFEGSCGNTKFRVTVVNYGHPLENRYSLGVTSPSGFKELFKSNEGGWFHAACLPAKDGSPLLVFQSYCGGSACLEGKYGAVVPSTLKVLLRPSNNNNENIKEISTLLGADVPHLGEFDKSFCCKN